MLFWDATQNVCLILLNPSSPKCCMTTKESLDLWRGMCKRKYKFQMCMCMRTRAHVCVNKIMESTLGNGGRVGARKEQNFKRRGSHRALKELVTTQKMKVTYHGQLASGSWIWWVQRASTNMLHSVTIAISLATQQPLKQKTLTTWSWLCSSPLHW